MNQRFANEDVWVSGLGSGLEMFFGYYISKYAKQEIEQL